MTRKIQRNASLNGFAEPQITIESNGSIENHRNRHSKVYDSKPTTERFRYFHFVFQRQHYTNALNEHMHQTDV